MHDTLEFARAQIVRVVPGPLLPDLILVTNSFTGESLDVDLYYFGDPPDIGGFLGRLEGARIYDTYRKGYRLMMEAGR